MNTAAKQDPAIMRIDHQDALRVVEAAITIAAIPRVISAVAREMAVARIRELATHHPHSAEIFSAIVQHLEAT